MQGRLWRRAGGARVMISAAGVRLAGVHNWVAGLERFPSLLPCTLYELLRWQVLGLISALK